LVAEQYGRGDTLKHVPGWGASCRVFAPFALVADQYGWGATLKHVPGWGASCRFFAPAGGGLCASWDTLKHVPAGGSASFGVSAPGPWGASCRVLRFPVFSFLA
jgi:hypothetical protein